MSEKPEEQPTPIFRDPNEMDQREFNSEKWLKALQDYVGKRLKETICIEPDGCLAEAITFQGIDPDSISITPTFNTHTDLPVYSIEARRNRHNIKRITLVEALVGGTFREISCMVEEEITLLPSNALQFMYKFTDGFPSGILPLPDTEEAHRTFGIGAGLSRTTHNFPLPDYRDSDLGFCIQNALDILKQISDVIRQSKAFKIAISVHPSNQWLLQLHEIHRSYVSMFSRLIDEKINNPNVGLVERKKDIPDDYKRDEADFIATFCEFSGDFPVYLIEELRSRLETMRENGYQSFFLFIRNLSPANGGPIEGVLVEIYKQLRPTKDETD